jgi:hypothetical protein
MRLSVSAGRTDDRFAQYTVSLKRVAPIQLSIWDGREFQYGNRLTASDVCVLEIWVLGDRTHH